VSAPARRAFLDRFEREIDPDGVLKPEERARRAEHARKVYFFEAGVGFGGGPSAHLKTYLAAVPSCIRRCASWVRSSARLAAYRFSICRDRQPANRMRSPSESSAASHW
jgi:hypothetical protein